MAKQKSNYMDGPEGGFFSRFGQAVTKGDLFVKLSLVWMGAGYARRKQYVKAALMTVFEIAVILFTFMFALEYVPKFGSLGTVMQEKSFNVVTMPPAAAQMMMKAVGFLLLVHIFFQIVVFLFWRHPYTTEHVVTPGDPEPGRLSVAAILPAQMIGAFKPVYL